MDTELLVNTRQIRKEMAAFVAAEILPYANDWDKAGFMPPEAIDKLAAKGYLGFTIPVKYGGMGMDQLSYGILNEEVGRACSSLRSLITVHSSLVAETIARWGTEQQKDYWLPLLATHPRVRSSLCSIARIQSGSSTSWR